VLSQQNHPARHGRDGSHTLSTRIFLVAEQAGVHHVVVLVLKVCLRHELVAEELWEEDSASKVKAEIDIVIWKL